MIFKARLLILGLLSVMAFGAIASGPAFAEPGPFWHHRSGEGKEEGKVEKTAPETFTAEGTGTELKSVVSNNAFTLNCNIKASGAIWNETNQGQGKTKVTYEKCTVPSVKSECTATVTAPKEPYTMWLDWKYEGKPKELENIKPQKSIQGWDLVFLPPGVTFVANSEGTELELSESKASFAEVIFGPTKVCGIIGSLTGKASGSTAAGSSLNLETFSKEPILKFPGGIPRQHDWWPALSRFLPLSAKLLFTTNEAKFSGELPLKFTKQEISVFES